MSYEERRKRTDEAGTCPFCGGGGRLVDSDYYEREYCDLYACEACGREYNEIYRYDHTEYWEERRWTSTRRS